MERQEVGEIEESFDEVVDLIVGNINRMKRLIENLKKRTEK